MAAAEEAREEAGVVGLALAESIGSYTYRKSHPAGPIAVRVHVYLLEVSEELELARVDQRKRAWFELGMQLPRLRNPNCVTSSDKRAIDMNSKPMASVVKDDHRGRY